jgi:molybdopterin-guanine dinucleotide biosynthesis protein A
MPFLNQALLSYIIQLAPGFDAVVPRLGNMVEPLHAVYSNSCAAPIEWLLKQGNLKTSEVLPFIRVRYIEAQEIIRFDPRHLSLFNVNTESDLVKARELSRASRRDVEC